MLPQQKDDAVMMDQPGGSIPPNKSIKFHAIDGGSQDEGKFIAVTAMPCTPSPSSKLRVKNGKKADVPMSAAGSALSKATAGDAGEPKHCNCKGGQCRQLYCVCRKRGSACIPGVCQCHGCKNDDSEEAIQARAEQKRVLDEGVRKGCNCKKNYCKKNYCICHHGGLKCDPDLCHCSDCYNYEGAPPPPGKSASTSSK